MIQPMRELYSRAHGLGCTKVFALGNSTYSVVSFDHDMVPYQTETCYNCVYAIDRACKVAEHEDFRWRAYLWKGGMRDDIQLWQWKEGQH